VNEWRFDTAGREQTSFQTREVQRVTLWGLALNLALAVLKFVVGIVGTSHALVADAVHSLSDTVTDMAVVIGAPYWSAKADADHPYGHGRIETLITVVIGVALAGVGLGLAYNALLTLQRPPAESPEWIALAAACVSIVTKEWLYRWTIGVGRRAKSSALMANAWHHRSDALSSIPVAIAVVGARLSPLWWFLDPVAAVIVSILILHAAWRILLPALNQLVDAGASRETQERLIALVNQTEGVKTLHALRTRLIGPGLQVDLHIRVDADLTVRQGHEIAHQVKDRLLAHGPDVVDVLIHVEPHHPKAAPAGH